MESTKSTWSTLRWPFKAIVIAAPLLLIGYLGLQKGWFKAGQSTTESPSMPGGNNGGGTGETSTTPSNTNAGNTTKTTGNSGRSFNYQPQDPVNGTLKGIVEVGATGFNAFVINVDKEKRYKLIMKEFGKSFVYENLATTDDIRKGLRDYIANISAKGVSSRNVHFVISSGAQKVEKTKVIADELKKMGYVVNLVTPEQEGKLALKSVLPKEYYDNSFVVDIGSGNTKISWPTGETVASKEAPGAKYYEKQMSDGDVSAQVKAAAALVPPNKRSVCFIIGGVPFQMAKQVRQGDERYTVLGEPSGYDAGTDAKLKCGLNIYKALKDATNCDTFVFDWDANFSIGFLLGLP
jgi:hypothetical protein